METRGDHIVKDDYMLTRGFWANNRINLQHYLWHDDLGYILHPSVPTTGENLRIADIGSGSSIWLIEMARRLPKSAQLDGLDVSHEQSPPSQLLPANIQLHVHNCLLKPPAGLVGVYDILHLQNFNSVVKDNDPAAVLQNLLTMLKPGGFISWGEYDFQSWRTETLTSDIEYHDELNSALQYMATMGDTQEANFLNHNWTAKLPQTFTELGLQNVIADRRPFEADKTAFLLDTFMVASWEVSTNVLDGLGGGRGELMRSYVDAVGRNRKSLRVNLDRLTVIGQKPRK